MHKRLAILRTLPILLGMSLFCFAAVATTAAAEKPVILVSIAPQKYFVERLAGDLVHVEVLVPAGADPHSYEPTPSQMRAAYHAVLFVTVGINFEQAWAQRIQSLSPSMQVLDLSMRGGHLHAHPDQQPTNNKESETYAGHHHDGDHVWLSPVLVRQMVPALVAKLSTLLPEQHALLQQNAKAFLHDIDLLDQDIRQQFVNIPAEKRIFMTFHPAWKNFAEAYNLTEISIEADGKEPGLRQMTELVQMAKERGIQVIFIEPQFPKNAALSIAGSIGGTVETADPLSANWLVNLQSVAHNLAAAMR